MNRGTIRTEAAMGTLVTIHAVRPAADAAVARAFEWFHEIEGRCSRFDEDSELRQLLRHVRVPVEVGAILFEAVRFALSLAEETGGAFDPTAGHYRDVTVDPEQRTITLHRPLTLDLGGRGEGAGYRYRGTRTGADGRLCNRRRRRSLSRRFESA
ncbi:MAG: FAD:protein FMN transferase [Ignavibacteriota bacterium]